MWVRLGLFSLGLALFASVEQSGALQVAFAIFLCCRCSLQAFFVGYELFFREFCVCMG
jgi:hypothetical protein